MLKLLVVDDEYFVRLGLTKSINWHEYGIEVVGEAENGIEALEKTRALTPDILICDVCMPFMDGVALMGEVRKFNSDVKIIVLSGHDEFEYARAAIAAGASAYLLKPLQEKELHSTITAVVNEIQEDRNRRDYYSRLDGSLADSKRYLLRDVLLGRVEAASLPDGAFEKTDNTVITAVLFDSLHQKGKEEVNAQTLSNSLEGFLAKAGLKNCLCILIDETEIAIAANIKEISGDELREMLLLAAGKTGEEAGQWFSMGISNNIANKNQLCQSYAIARETAGLNKIPGRNTAVFAGESSMPGIRPDIKAVLQFIKENHHMDLTVEQAANKLRMSPYYLMHLLKDETGKTFLEQLTECRMETACQLLKNENYKVFEVGRLVGYSDPKYFSRIFKKRTGMLPSEYRAKG